MGTFSKFLAAWGEGNYKRTGNEYRGHNPFVAGSDGNAFTVTFIDEEHAPWMDHKNSIGGSLYEACAKLNIEIDRATTAKPALSSLRAYAGLDDYAAGNLGVAGDVLVKWQWREAMKYCSVHEKERPALEYPTKGGLRYRMLDGLKPKYLSKAGYKPCWYGLNFALDMIRGVLDFPLILCNGEPSTILAQHYGIPAICAPGGEHQLSAELIQQLRAALTELPTPPVFWIVLDCDDTGRTAAKKIQAQLVALGYEAFVFDLKLPEHGDLADYCRLHEVETFEYLGKLTPIITDVSGVVGSKAVAQRAIAHIHTAPEGQTVVFPFKAFHRLGGMCRVIDPGEVVIISGISGGGKTSFAECLTEPLVQKGMRILWDGKEWSPAKMHARRVQRLKGITTEQQKLHNRWKDEIARGIAGTLCEGVRFTPEQEQAYMDASYMIARYKGEVDYMPLAPCLEDTLGLMSERLTYYRARREPVPLVVFDYAQLWVLNSANNAPSNLFEFALDKVKNWTLRENVVAFVLSQSNKEATDKVKVADSTYLLTSADAQFIRDDKCNLMITLNPQYEEDRNHMHNGKAQLRKREYIVANVVKNSDGDEGFVRLQTWWERLTIMDKIMPTVKVDMDE